MAKVNGFVVYHGPSAINGETIVAIVTTATSKNPKTGDMAQLWILDAGQAPIAAVKSGNDESVCGQCPLRGESGKKRLCYVNLAFAPSAVYRAWKRGVYSSGLPAASDRPLRLGAYGDPAALPYEVVDSLLAKFGRHTGYTHQWRACDERYKAVLMASVEASQDVVAANLAGWRTARVDSKSYTLSTNEIVCPATEEGGKRTTCEKCGLCAGNSATSHGVKSIVFPVHGWGAKSESLVQLVLGASA